MEFKHGYRLKQNEQYEERLIVTLKGSLWDRLRVFTYFDITHKKNKAIVFPIKFRPSSGFYATRETLSSKHQPLQC